MVGHGGDGMGAKVAQDWTSRVCSLRGELSLEKGGKLDGRFEDGTSRHAADHTNAGEGAERVVGGDEGT